MYKPKTRRSMKQERNKLNAEELFYLRLCAILLKKTIDRDRFIGWGLM